MKGITYAEYRQLLGKEKLIMKKNIVKRIIALFLLIVLCAAIFCACKKYKIDVGGKVEPCKPSPDTAVRVMMKKSVYSQDEDIEVRFGYGFRFSSLNESYLKEGVPMEILIDCEGFSISDGETVYADHYSKSIMSYSNKEYIADKKRNRYMPNHFETYTIKVNSEEKQTEGSISFVAGFSSEGSISMDSAIIFYATEEGKISFSEKSVEDAKKKLS